MIVSRLLFIIYMACALYILLLSEGFGRTTYDHYRYNLTPFVEIKRFYHLLGSSRTRKAVINLFGNVICFIPFGLYLAFDMRKAKVRLIKVTFLSFVFSLCIELTQLFMKIGIFDVDDLILNTLGGMIGGLLYGICRVVSRIAGSRARKKDTG